MTFNRNNTESCYYLVDEYGMVVLRPFPWDTPPNIGNRGDSVINTSLCAIAYEDYHPFLHALYSCIPDDDEPFKLLRHPLLTDRDNFSRDQLTLMIAALRIRNADMLYILLDRLKWRISGKFTQTVDLWLWQKSIKHESVWLATLHSLWCIPGAAIKPLWNKFLFSLVGWSDKSEMDYRPTDRSKYSWLEKIVYKLHYPQYALDKFIWQVFTLPWNPLKHIVNRLTLKGVEETNYVERMMLGDKVCRCEFANYKPFTGYRWSARLNETSQLTEPLNDRYTDNLIDVAMLERIYELTQTT